jgi:magnesium transporter
MSGNAARAVEVLNRRFFVDHPAEAAWRIEEMPRAEAAAALAGQSVEELVPMWCRLAPDVSASLLDHLPEAMARGLLSEMLPNEAIRLLGVMQEEQREKYLGLLEPEIRDELKALMAYPEDCAGRLMDTRVTAFRESMLVGGALDILRRARVKTTRSLFLIDDENKLTAKVAIQDLAVADPDQRLADLAEPVSASVNPLAPQKEVAETLERFKLADLPVVNVDGVLLGVVYHATLVQTMQKDATASIQTMVGASKDERALSKPLFAVRKRLPWLQINLLTAFLAASVVGIFEDTIARFTALAVLLPVVAGQSGNAGAQALAVTMRGLALREISVRHWLAVTVKEISVGFLNGVAVAVTCAIGVLVWSGSFGLMFVIAVSMVLAMVAAGFAGAVVPISVTRLGQDPAQSSSIILTTVTDVAGFFSFLGIATLLAGWL